MPKRPPGVATERRANGAGFRGSNELLDPCYASRPRASEPSEAAVRCLESRRPPPVRRTAALVTHRRRRRSGHYIPLLTETQPCIPSFLSVSTSLPPPPPRTIVIFEMFLRIFYLPITQAVLQSALHRRSDVFPLARHDRSTVEEAICMHISSQSATSDRIIAGHSTRAAHAGRRLAVSSLQRTG